MGEAAMMEEAEDARRVAELKGMKETDMAENVEEPTEAVAKIQAEERSERGIRENARLEEIKRVMRLREDRLRREAEETARLEEERLQREAVDKARIDEQELARKEAEEK